MPSNQGHESKEPLFISDEIDMPGWQSIQEMESDALAALDRHSKLRKGSCSSDLQVSGIADLRSVYKRLAQSKSEGAQNNDFDQANVAFVLQLLIAALVNHIQVWLLLKSDQAIIAWDALVDAQNNLSTALAFVQDGVFGDWLLELNTLEENLFPPQRFVSSAFTYDYAQCTICGGEYGECGHFAGRVYGRAIAS